MMESGRIEVQALKGCDEGGVFYLAMIPVRQLPQLFSNALTRTDVDAKRVNAIQKALRDATKVDSVPICTLVTTTSACFQHARRSIFGSLNLDPNATFHIASGVETCVAAVRQRRWSTANEGNDFAVKIRFGVAKSIAANFAAAIPVSGQGTKSQRVQTNTDDATAKITLATIDQVPYFAGRVERIKTSISNRSVKLFTLSVLYEANRDLLADRLDEGDDANTELAIKFWTTIGDCIPQWQEVICGDLQPASCRENYIHSQGIMLRAFARAGRQLICKSPKTWHHKLRRISIINFSRDNPAWQEVAIVNGRISKSHRAIDWVTDFLTESIGGRIHRQERKPKSE